MSRDRLVMVRLGEGEYAALVHASLAEGLAVSTWVREVSLEMAEALRRREVGDVEGRSDT